MSLEQIFDYIPLASIKGFMTPMLILTLSIISLLMAIASMVITPFLIVKVPADYFKREQPSLWERLKTSSPLYGCAILLKNLVGVLCLILGFLMLFLPGQGLLTILAGVFLLDFRGKSNLERKILKSPKVLQTINWLRQKYGKQHLDL